MYRPVPVRPSLDDWWSPDFECALIIAATYERQGNMSAVSE